jgi:hypothetical protein
MQYINLFISELSLEETNLEKQNKLLSLCLSNDEWERVKESLGLLKASWRMFFILPPFLMLL